MVLCVLDGRCSCVVLVYVSLWCDIVCVVSRVCLIFFFQAEDGIRDLVRSRGLGDVYKRQAVKAMGCLSPGQSPPGGWHYV